MKTKAFCPGLRFNQAGRQNTMYRIERFLSSWPPSQAPAVSAVHRAILQFTAKLDRLYSAIDDPDAPKLCKPATPPSEEKNRHATPACPLRM
jgi:hypothetical protein